MTGDELPPGATADNVVQFFKVNPPSDWFNTVFAIGHAKVENCGPPENVEVWIDELRENFHAIVMKKEK